MAGHIVIAVLLGVLAALSPSTAAAQEIRFGFFDATVDVEGIGANSYPGLSIGGSVPVAAAVPVAVYARYNRDYGSDQKLTDYVVPSLQLGVAVRAVSMRNLAASLPTWRHPRVPEEHNTDHPHSRSRRHTGRALRTGGQHRLRNQRRGDDHRINDGALRQVLAPAVAHGPPSLSASKSRRTSSSEFPTATCGGYLARSGTCRRRSTRRGTMLKPRWPEPTNPVSEVPGTVHLSWHIEPRVIQPPIAVGPLSVSCKSLNISDFTTNTCDIYALFTAI